MNQDNQNPSMSENDGNDPSSSGLPLGQSSNMLESQLNEQATESKSISENEIMQLLGDEESDGNDNQLDDEEDDNEVQRPDKRMRHYRHTQHQIQEMEALFKDCPQPNGNQMNELSRKLGLEPLQIKFWFQNRRTKQKNQGKRLENLSLRAENDMLRAECVGFNEAIINVCPNCDVRSGETSVTAQQLMLENARLKKEVDRLAYSYTIKVAMAAVEELLVMAQMGEPLWLPNIDGGAHVLSNEEYERRFLGGKRPNPQGIKKEASKEHAHVIINHIDLVKILMDTNQWASLFSSIVSKAFTVNVLSTGVAGDLHGAMQMMYGEFQVPSPQIPTRDCYFIRFCKRIIYGVWVVVDFSLDHTPSTRYRKRPSGCLIQEISNSNTKVTWIEHIETNDTSTHNIYMPLVDSGLAFGAKRWIATLNRQCDRLASAMATYLPRNDIFHWVSADKERIKSLLKLGERMIISYCSGVRATTSQQWTTLRSGNGFGSDINDVRVMFRQSIDDPGRPCGIVLSAATSFWLPMPQKSVFDFLRDEKTRGKWDILSYGSNIQEVAHIANGSDTGNCVSILRVNSLNSTENDMLMVQESSTDPTGSFIVYAPIDIAAMNKVLCGGNPDYVQLLPSGFSILPDGLSGEGDVDFCGSLLTVAFQILVDNVPTAILSPQSVDSVKNLISCTINNIKVALLCDVPLLIDLVQ